MIAGHCARRLLGAALVGAAMLGGGAPLAAQERTAGVSAPQSPAAAADPQADPAAAAAAAAEPDPGSATATRATYTPADFTRFAPRTALDMARQVPGFAIREGGGARGLGQADTNVLINGRRISGKSNGPVDALRRIPTEEVVRLELVDGASLDIGGLTGQVLNVVTAASGRITGQFRYSPQVRTRGVPPRLFNGTVGIAGGSSKTDWTLALENASERRGNDGPEQVFDGAGRLVAEREEIANFNSDRIALSGSFSRTADNGNVLNLTGEAVGFLFRSRELSEQNPVGRPIDRVRLLEGTEDEFNFELGGDYEFALGRGRLKLIGYHRFEDSPTTSNVVTDFRDGRPAQGSLFARDADEGETIARAEYTVPALGGSMVAAIEGVSNFLDITSALSVRDGEGVLRPVELPGASARVGEGRVDAGLTYSRALARSLQLQLSLGGEYSRLSQSGPFGQTRQFWRPKGFAALDWKATPALNLAGRIERVVGQLNFFDFIAVVNLDEGRTDVANANLVPEQSWNTEIEASLKLGALGSLNVRGFLEALTDVVDQIPIEGGGQAPGNLPAAQFYGLDGNLTLLSDRFGWRGTRFDLGFSFVDSAVRDPLTGVRRQVSETDIIDLNASLRHDVPGSDWALGTQLFWEDNTPLVRLDEISLETQSLGFLRAFVENKNIAGLTLRANVSNLLNQRDFFKRTVFADRRAGIAAFSEDRTRTFGTIFTLDIEGSF